MLAQVFSADGRHVHERHDLAVSMHFLAQLQISLISALYRLLQFSGLDGHILQDGLKGRMAAVV